LDLSTGCESRELTYSKQARYHLAMVEIEIEFAFADMFPDNTDRNDRGILP